MLKAGTCDLSAERFSPNHISVECFKISFHLNAANAILSIIDKDLVEVVDGVKYPSEEITKGLDKIIDRENFRMSDFKGDDEKIARICAQMVTFIATKSHAAFCKREGTTPLPYREQVSAWNQELRAVDMTFNRIFTDFGDGKLAV